jgi:hypothetical protein
MLCLEISRSSTGPVDVAVSRYFRTSGLRRFETSRCKAWKSPGVVQARLAWQSLVTSGLRALGAQNVKHGKLSK